MGQVSLFFTIAIVVTATKFLLIPTYRSTDFEVHRNWLAITHSLPISRWYIEKTSEWTLDYPPLFAWFEYGLSHVARLFDPAMLIVTNLQYASDKTILFQRLSVILADVLLIFAVHEYSKFFNHQKRGKSEPHDPWSDPRIILAMLVLWNPGLLIVDHIHFQYNGFLSGILLLSIVRMLQHRTLESAFWFSVLLNLKHIYLYVAPAYFVYLLCTYCFRKGPANLIEFVPINFIKLGAIVVSVFTISFGPFLLMGQSTQVLSRLFPFKRGLTHAYWAPNFWALYNTIDKGLSLLKKLFGQEIQSGGSMTGGLVEEYTHSVLPKVTPLATLMLTCMALMPAVFVVWKGRNSPSNFVRGIVLCAFASFLFGWHVHEKAILIAILPLTPLVINSYKEAEIFALLAPVAHFSLLPLLYKPSETPLKLLLVMMHTVYIFTTMKYLYKSSYVKSRILPFLSTVESCYILGLVPLQVFYSFGAKLLGLEDKLPFLPLMLISAYCALGIFYCWFKLIFHSINVVNYTDESVQEKILRVFNESGSQISSLRQRKKLHVS